MEFRLVYQGKLPAQSQRNPRPDEKHHIRKILHKQLVELWHSQWPLTQYFDPKEADRQGRLPVHHMANNYARCGFRFLPLIGGPFGGLACALDILFLRRDQPGGLVVSGGDIDNRIKVLFDALKVPTHCNELGSAQPDADEDPFFCLLEDDSLITEVKITTDRLLTPLATDERIHDVHLVIHVKTLQVQDRMFFKRL